VGNNSTYRKCGPLSAWEYERGLAQFLMATDRETRSYAIPSELAGILLHRVAAEHDLTEESQGASAAPDVQAATGQSLVLPEGVRAARVHAQPTALQRGKCKHTVRRRGAVQSASSVESRTQQQLASQAVRSS